MSSGRYEGLEGVTDLGPDRTEAEESDWESQNAHIKAKFREAVAFTIGLAVGLLIAIFVVSS